jgi:site-specific DNA recombinase
MEQLTSGNCGTLADLARRTGRAPTEISRILPLAFLAPDIVRKVLEGRQPAELTAQTLKRTKPLPVMWSEQRRRLGFAPAS